MIRYSAAVAVLLLFPAWLCGQEKDAGHEIALDLQAGNLAAAQAKLRAALATSPRDARLWTFDGLTRVRLEDTKGALESFQRALRLAPDYLPALEGAAHLEAQSASPSAIPLLRKIVDKRPDDPDSLRELAGALTRDGKTAEAIPVLEHLHELQPSDGSVFDALATAWFLTGRYQDVIHALAGAASSARELELLGESYEFTGDTRQAAAKLQQAIAADPDVPDAYTDYAWLCLAHGHVNQGLEALNSGIARMPRGASLYVARGVLLSELGRYEEGETDFTAARQLDPDVALGSAAQGLSELQENDLPKAEATVRERLRAHPDDAFLCYLMAEILTRQGALPGSKEFTQALDYARNAVRHNPRLNVARDLLARLYLKDGKIAEAVEQSRAAYRANPSDESALYHLIVALRRSGNDAEVPKLLEQLTRMKKMGPTFTEIRD